MFWKGGSGPSIRRPAKRSCRSASPDHPKALPRVLPACLPAMLPWLHRPHVEAAKCQIRHGWLEECGGGTLAGETAALQCRVGQCPAESLA